MGSKVKKLFPVAKALRAFECLGLVHADLWGPMSTKSLDVSRYFLLITDDFSRMS